MGEYGLVKIVKSDKPGKKMMAVFRNKKTGKEKVTHFGDATMSDYTKHKNNKRKGNYKGRHKKDLATGDPTRAGYLSYYILWGKSTSLRENIAAYKSRFFPGKAPSKKKPKKRMSSPKPSKSTGLRRWFAEEWVTSSGKKCGDPSEKVKKCRPKKRINKKTPVTWNEMTPAQRKKAVSLKKKVGMGRKAPVIRKRKTKVSAPKGAVPADPALYARIKSKVKARTLANGKTWPSAYGSGQLVQAYKRAGGTYR